MDDNFLDLGSEGLRGWPRDTKIDEAKRRLLAYFEKNPTGVFYEDQLEIIFERDFYQWITGKPLHELTAERSLASELLSLSGAVVIRFYRLPAHRGWRRQAKEIFGLVSIFSNEDFARAWAAWRTNC